jgi:hypothetical protein
MVLSTKVIADCREIGVGKAVVLQKRRVFPWCDGEFFQGGFRLKSIKEIPERKSPFPLLGG